MPTCARNTGACSSEGILAIAKSTTLVDFEENMKLIKEHDPGAWDFLVKKKPQQWCRCFFSSSPKCDSADNNMAEVFNASIIEVCCSLQIVFNL